MYTYLSLFISLSLSLIEKDSVSLLWMSGLFLGYIITHCMSIYVSGSYLFLSFSLRISVVVIGYIITHCMCIGLFLDSCFLLCFSFNADTVTDCNSIGTSLDPCLSLFLSFFFFFWGGGGGGGGGGQCFYPCTAILSLLKRVKVCLLIRVSVSVFVLSVRLCPGILSAISCMWRSAFSSFSE